MILGCDPAIATFGWAVIDPAVRPIRLVGIGFIEAKSNPRLNEHTDRARRARNQARELAAVAARFPITAIAAEQVSLGGPPNARVSMALALGLSWGVITDLAERLGVPIYEVPPKTWQHAVQPEAEGKKVDYAIVEARLRKLARAHQPEQLDAIAPGKQSHPLDGFGVALFAALRPREATRIGGPGGAGAVSQIDSNRRRDA